MKQKLKSGEEVDVIVGKRHYNWQAGQRATVKKALNKRLRKSHKLNLDS
tara:strand:- start:1382 stop:1528 length:147 start_codon:yes stop_codon:yes gene_type:complete